MGGAWGWRWAHGSLVRFSMSLDGSVCEVGRLAGAGYWLEAPSRLRPFEVKAGEDTVGVTEAWGLVGTSTRFFLC